MKTSIRIIAGLGSLAIFVVLALGVAVSALLWTEQGENLLRWQTERIVSAFVGPAFSVEFARQRVGFGPAGTLGIRFSDIAIRDRRTGQAVGTAGSVRAGIGLGALLGGRLAVDRVSVDTVRIDPSVLDNLRSGKAFVPEDLFTGLDRPFVAIEAIGLRGIEVRDLAVLGRDTYRLENLEIAADASGHFTMDAKGIVADHALALSGTAILDQSRQRIDELVARTSEQELQWGRGAAIGDDDALGLVLPASFAVSLTTTASGRRVTASVNGHDGWIVGKARQPVTSARGSISLAEGEDDLTISDGWIDFGTAEAEFTGRIDLIPDGSGRHRLELGTTRLDSSAGNSDAPVSASLKAVGEVNFGLGRFTFGELSLRTDRGELTGTSELTGLTSADRVRLDLAATALTTADIKAFWPFFIADKARAWVLGHVAEAGSVPTGSLALDISLARLAEIAVPGEGPNGDEVRLAIDFEGGTFATIGDMPAARTVSGTLDYRDGKALITIATGSIAGFPSLDIMPSSLDFVRADHGVAASLSLNLAGDASALLRLADREPVGVSRKFSWGSDDVTGQARVGVGVAFLLGQPTAEEDRLESWSIFAELDGVGLERRIDGRDIKAVSGTVTIAPGAAIGDVAAAIDGMPARVEFSQPIGPNPIGEATLDVTARLSDDEVRAVLPMLGEFVDGPLSARLTRVGDGFRARLDLGTARLDMPVVGWTKGPGVPATLAFDLSVSGEQISMRNVELSGEGFSAKGSIEVDGDGLKSVTLDSAALNRGDDISGQFIRGDEGYVLDIAGRSLDARSMLDRLRRETLAANPDQPSNREAINATIALDRLLGFDGEEFRNATIRYKSGGSVSFSADTPAGHPIKLDFRPQGADRTIGLATDDAGSLLRFGGLYRRMQGGTARLQLSGMASGGFSGALKLQDFTLVDEPRLANLVGTTRAGSQSLAGAVGRDLEVSRAYFDSASVGLAWNGRQLSAREGIVRGPIFGSSFEGTLYDSREQIDISGSFMPAYAINRLFGALPFVGGILGNGAEGALIGITYRLAGAFGDPTLTVNPISAIAPGIFRRIFEY
ncbi:MAG TPA: hypothetical protein VIN77_07050 [Aurantimonas sp.]